MRVCPGRGESDGLTMNGSPDKLDYLNISLDDTGLCEYEADKCLVRLPTNEIVSLSVGYGYILRFPALACLLGVALMLSGVLFGLYPLARLLVHNQNYGFLFLKGFGLFVFNIPLGYWLARTSLRKSNFLLVRTKKGPVKLKVKGEIDEDLLNSFLFNLRNKLGVEIS